MVTAFFCLAELAEHETLTVDYHLEESSRASSTASPGANSPPLNNSSESGDSGVESGVYSCVGKFNAMALY